MERVPKHEVLIQVARHGMPAETCAHYPTLRSILNGHSFYGQHSAQKIIKLSCHDCSKGQRTHKPKHYSGS